MTTTAIRKKLMTFIAAADDKRVKGMYLLLEDEIQQDELEYTKEFKAELDRRYQHYKKGGNMVSATDANKQIRSLFKNGKGR
jgi:hypothetical protein